RKINVICDHCLMSGYAEDKKIITSAIVKESAEELRVPERRRTIKQERPVPPSQPYTMMPLTPSAEQPRAGMAGPPQSPDKVKQKTSSWLTGLLLSLLIII